MFNEQSRNTRDERPPAVAGRFYPADASKLRAEVEGFLQHAAPAGTVGVKAVIAPHAGYMFSGPIAGTAYAVLRADRNVITRVVLIGPAHFESFDGLALPSHSSFSTPLGSVPVDRDACEALLQKKLAFTLDSAHQREHSLEVQLPFLQVILREFSIVPLLAGSSSGDEVGRAIDALWGGPETRFVISSDLSHYLDWASAKEIDGRTARAIEKLRPEEIDNFCACGRLPIMGIMNAARTHHLGVKTLDLRNSGETAGPRDQVVGYGAFSFSERKG